MRSSEQRKVSILLSALTLFSITAFQTTETGIGFLAYTQKYHYQFSAADKIEILPQALKEVSGIAFISSTSLACIQDEDGIIFIYNTVTNKIDQTVRFAEKGDYEDIAVIKNTAWVLRSDGLLIEVDNFRSGTLSVTRYKTGVPSNNNEGLCYDEKNNRLLIGCKNEVIMENSKNRRAVYAFDLAGKKLEKEPVIVLEPKKIRETAEKNKKSFGLKNSQIDDAEMRISAIGIHPLTGDIFVLSSADKLLYVFTGDGLIDEIYPLEKELFKQPEGLTFLMNGDLFISNEGRGGKPTLLRFNYRAGK